jgi:hypothetical protein
LTGYQLLNTSFQRRREGFRPAADRNAPTHKATGAFEFRQLATMSVVAVVGVRPFKPADLLIIFMVYFRFLYLAHSRNVRVRRCVTRRDFLPLRHSFFSD